MNDWNDANEDPLESIREDFTIISSLDVYPETVYLTDLLVDSKKLRNHPLMQSKNVGQSDTFVTAVNVNDTLFIFTNSVTGTNKSVARLVVPLADNAFVSLFPIDAFIDCFKTVENP